MKQKNLVKEMYKACLDHDRERQLELGQKEFQKVFKHKQDEKPFNVKWTVIRQDIKMHIDPRYSIQQVHPTYATPKVAEPKVAEMQVQHFVTVINPDLSVSIKNIIDDFYTYDHLHGKIVMKKVICRINSTTFNPIDA